jgi:hypothetical protein
LTAIPSESWSQSDQEAIRAQLQLILRSGPFAQSQRRQRFLEYIVNETLAGRGHRLKGYTIAREVFDRPEEFDPNLDPIVRMEAARLRDRLREYYDGDGKNDLIRIELPKGSYTPQIELRGHVGKAAEEALVDRTAVKPGAAPSRRTGGGLLSRSLRWPCCLRLPVCGLPSATGSRRQTWPRDLGKASPTSPASPCCPSSI